MFSQMHDEILKPMTFFFRKINSAECNYIIYNKKLLTIVNNFENWRLELTEMHKKVKIFSNHQNLKYFMTTKKLNRRQVRWVKLLFEFNFKIKFRPEKQSAKPDAFIRRSQDLPKGAKNKRTTYREQIVFKHNQLDNGIIESLKLNTAHLLAKS